MRFYRAVIYIRFFDGRSGSLALNRGDWRAQLAHLLSVWGGSRFSPYEVSFSGVVRCVDSGVSQRSWYWRQGRWAGAFARCCVAG